MDELLAPEVLAELQTRYLHAVRRAELGYVDELPDADVLTSALAEACTQPGEDVQARDGRVYHVSFEYESLEGGLSGLGVFEAEILDAAGKPIFRKGLLFCATVLWKGRQQKLLDRARDLNGNFRRSIVIDFSPAGYYAASSAHVLAANGDRGRMRHRMRKLEEVLGIDFVHCRMGLPGLDRNAFAIRHVLATRIRRVG